MTFRLRTTGLIACAFSALFVHLASCAADIKVMSSNAMTETMSELTPEFERLTGHKILGIYEPTNLILERLKQGETADVVILIKPNLAALVKNKVARESTAVDLAKTALNLAMKSGGVKPDISSNESFRKAMLNSKSIAISKAGASGSRFKQALESEGVLTQVQSRLREVDGAERVGDYAVDGRTQYAVQMKSELLPVKGIEIIGPLPGLLNFEIVLSAAVTENTKNERAAQQLIKFLSAPTAAPVYKRTGMDPF